MPIDGSPTSTKAADYAIHIAACEKSEIVLLHVLEGVKQGGAIGLQARYGNTRLFEGLQKIRIDAIEHYISQIKVAAEKEKVGIKSEILDDDGVSEVGVITRYAEKNNVDLIVMGSRGLSKFKRMLLGSVANAVVNHSKCPVLVVR
ncbi:MAG TPA: universal stress protein [Nitrososphaera sp.]|nr:universal stress protein [Nitrososphaera sp.]